MVNYCTSCHVNLVKLNIDHKMSLFFNPYTLIASVSVLVCSILGGTNDNYYSDRDPRQYT